MLNYANLSDVEFEYLCQDIMQKKLNISLRRFAQGKDGGIDLTDDVLQTNIIVQVKHYNLSSIDALIRSLKKEKEKIKIHKPKQYYICCSKNLNLINIISPLFVGEHRKKFVKTAIELVKDAINDLADNVSADSYISNPESAIRYGMHEEYFDLDEAVSELEDEVVESALNDIANNIKKLPFDICIDEDFVDNIFWNVDGSEELIQSYMEDNDDDDDSDNKRLESAVSEIDYIFNRKL